LIGCVCGVVVGVVGVGWWLVLVVEFYDFGVCDVRFCGLVVGY